MRALVPEDLHRNGNRGIASLARACIVVGRQTLDPHMSLQPFVRERGWDHDRVAGILTRGATGPATTTGVGWAKELGQISFELLEGLAAVSAGAALLRRGLQLDFGLAAQISLPAVAPGVCTFVGEGAPISVRSFATTAPTLSPRKMACIVELTSEMMQSSNGEALVRAALLESVGKGLDQILFDDQPGDALRPAGVRNGVAGLTPATAGAGAKGQALEDDIVALGAAVGAVASGPFTYVAALPQAIALIVRTHGSFRDIVLPSAALPAGMVICVADVALASATEGPPQIDASRMAEIHRDTTPAPIGTTGPVASVFQSDTVALRLRWPISWVLRASGAVAWMSGVNW